MNSIRKITSKYFFFPVIKRNIKFLRYLKELENSQWLTLEEIQKIQLQKLKRIIEYSQGNIQYYKELLSNKVDRKYCITSLEDLSIIPTLSKKIIKKNFYYLLNSKLNVNKLYKSTTSGSSGEPVTIYRDQHSEKIHTAVGWRFRRWSSHDIGDKYARIWGYSTQQKSNNKIKFISKIKQNITHFFDPIEQLNAFDSISDSAMENFLQIINTNKIKHLIGYSTSLFLFAQYVNRKHPGHLKLKSVRTISEMLYKDQRKFIENEFTCKIFDTYGNKENGLIAAECDHHCGYHINAENLIIEIIDPKGNPLNDGTSGEIVITDLNNYAMPLIRYRTGDIGNLLLKSCSCGRGLPVIEKISGRAIDMIQLSDGNHIDGSFIFDIIYENLKDSIERFRIIQDNKGEADLYLKLFKSLPQIQLDILKNKFKEKIGEKLILKYYFVENLPFEQSGKHKYIVSKIK
jgi:phenylacetate-CoA ligase